MPFSYSTLSPAVRIFTILTVLSMLSGTVLASGKLPKPGVPQSCGMQTKSNNFDIENLNKIHDAGFKLVRRGFYWPSIEKEKGKYTFEDYDEKMNKCKELGLTVIGVLFQQHKDYEDDERRGVTSEAGRKGFANYAAALAEHYKDYNVIWEVWNEPNTQTFWGKGKGNSPEFAKEYTDLVKEVVPAMLAKDPDVFVVAGSVSNYWQPSYEWTEACFKEGILKTGIRGWSVHPYGVKTPEEFEIGHRITRDLLKKYGAPEMPMVDTERGFSVKKTKEGWSGGSEEKTNEFQAWNCVRQYMIDQLFGLPFTIWYEWDKKEGFGIEDKTGPEQALTACKEMFRELDGYSFTKRIASNHYRDYLLMFEGPEGKRKIVAWTCPPPGGAPDNIEIHDVTLTVAGGNGDLTGKFGDAQVTGDAVRINLTGKPKYLPVPAGVNIVKCVSHAKFPLATAEMVQPKKLAEPVDLKLFADDKKWEFIENTGKGSIKLDKDKDGRSIGVLEYDFTNPSGGGTPYVMASAPCEFDKGAMELKLQVRSAIKQKLTFRVVDSTGQTHQVKSKIKKPDQWETITIPLNKKMEHWGGANDGIIHYPVKTILFSVPLPDPKNKTGKVEYADVIIQ